MEELGTTCKWPVDTTQVHQLPWGKDNQKLNTIIDLSKLPLNTVKEKSGYELVLFIPKVHLNCCQLSLKDKDAFFYFVNTNVLDRNELSSSLAKSLKC